MILKLFVIRGMSAAAVGLQTRTELGMRRRVRPVHFARLRISALVLTLMHAPQSKWPHHLQKAYGVLKEDLKVPDPTARAVLATSTQFARTCAKAVDQRALTLSRSENKEEVRKSFSRLAKCVARAPASMRAALDKRFDTLVSAGIDTEVVEAIVDAIDQVFARSKLEPAQTALRALNVVLCQDPRIIGLKIAYSGLDLASRRKCEAAVSSVERSSGSGAAITILTALAAVLKDEWDPASELSSEAGDLISDYVANIAALWRENGLPATRANCPGHPEYKSRLHRFADLVLTAVTEPGSNRHSPDLEQITQRSWAKHAQLDPELRNKIGKELKREDREWLVTDGHVRKALELCQMLVVAGTSRSLQ